MERKKVKILNLSDIHLGKRDRTARIVDNIIFFFVDYESELKDLDAIVITGDVFDRMLTTNSQDYILAMKAITYIVTFCIRYKIVLRVLEGTPSHDNKQMESISVAIESLVRNIDYKYISTLTIDDLCGYKCLFLPDKYRESGEEIQEAVAEKLKEHNLTSVDLMFGHGNFNYQLPATLKSALSEEFFLNIVKYYIVMGHIHLRSLFVRIISVGSFERIDANQEDSNKGGLLLHLGDSIDTSSFEYLDNKHTMRYDTISLVGMDIKDAYKKIRSHIIKHNMDMYDTIRIDADSVMYSEIVSSISKEFKIIFRKVKEVNRSTVVTSEVEPIDRGHIQTITADNIVSILLARDGFKDMSIEDKKQVEKIINNLRSDL